MENKKIIVGVLAGSLRKNSYSQSIARAVAGFLPDRFEIRQLEIGNLAIFNQDFDDEGTTPAEWTAFREQVSQLDAVLFVTPEYNRSFTPVLKNALDIASRPYGQNRWDGKPCLVVSISPGKLGGFGANHHLRQVLSFLNMHPLQQPEVYLGDVASFLDEQGNVIYSDTNGFLKSIAESFAEWVDRLV